MLPNKRMFSNENQTMNRLETYAKISVGLTAFHHCCGFKFRNWNVMGMILLFFSSIRKLKYKKFNTEKTTKMINSIPYPSQSFSMEPHETVLTLHFSPDWANISNSNKMQSLTKITYENHLMFVEVVGLSISASVVRELTILLEVKKFNYWFSVTQIRCQYHRIIILAKFYLL